jgi:hypothetical protein
MGFQLSGDGFFRTAALRENDAERLQGGLDQMEVDFQNLEGVGSAIRERIALAPDPRFTIVLLWGNPAGQTPDCRFCSF